MGNGTLDAVNKINQIGATAISLIALFKQLRDEYRANAGSGDPDPFLTDEMLIKEAREASLATVTTVDAIRERHGLTGSPGE